MPESESRSRLVLRIFIVILILVGSFSVFYYQYMKNAVKPQSNWYQQTREGQWGQDIKKAEELDKESNPFEAIKILENVKSQMTDPGERSVVDLTIASMTFFSIDMQKGAELYATIAKTVQYPNMSRAYAMLAVADQFSGLQDKNLLKPFFDKQEFMSKDQSTLILALYQQIYDMHRFGLVAGKLGISYLLKVRKDSGISDNDYAVAMQYVDDIDRNLPELETSDAFKRFVPVTLLNKAKLLRLIEDLNRPINQQDIGSIYLMAITRARILRISSTEQFSILYYADYLAKKKEKDQVIKLLSESLSSPTLHQMVKIFLSSEDRIKSSLPNLYKLKQEDVDVRAAYSRLTVAK